MLFVNGRLTISTEEHRIVNSTEEHRIVNRTYVCSFLSFKIDRYSFGGLVVREYIN